MEKRERAATGDGEARESGGGRGEERERRRQREKKKLKNGGRRKGKVLMYPSSLQRGHFVLPIGQNVLAIDQTHRLHNGPKLSTWQTMYHQPIARTKYPRYRLSKIFPNAPKILVPIYNSGNFPEKPIARTIGAFMLKNYPKNLQRRHSYIIAIYTCIARTICPRYRTYFLQCQPNITHNHITFQTRCNQLNITNIHIYISKYINSDHTLFKIYTLFKIRVPNIPYI